MRIFNHDFKRLSETTLMELFSLEREGAIYTNHWIEELQDFRHIRIAFTPEEVTEYVRSLWAYDLFLRVGAPARAADVPGIPPDIATRADSYSLRTITGQVSGPPYHCIAGFIGQALEKLTCFTPESRQVILEEQGKAALMTTVKRAIDSLTPIIRRFTRREKGLQSWPISREDDVRDLLYAMLRASIEDIRTEEPVPSRAGTSKVIDIFSGTARLFVEVKWIGKPGRWKRVLEEIAIDIQSYGTHPACNTLVFVIVDAVKDIPDPELVQRDLTGRQVIDGRQLDIRVFVREP